MRKSIRGPHLQFQGLPRCGCGLGNDCQQALAMQRAQLCAELCTQQDAQVLPLQRIASQKSHGRQCMHTLAGSAVQQQCVHTLAGNAVLRQCVHTLAGSAVLRQCVHMLAGSAVQRQCVHMLAGAGSGW